jgi:cyclohexanecarboxylate-CoA ligase
MPGMIAQLLDDSACERPDEPLLIDTLGSVLTVGEVATLTASATQWLWNAGVRPGMTVGWQLPSHSAGVLTMLALARCDVLQAPVLHLYRSREVAAAVGAARIDLLIVDESTRCNAPTNIPVVVLPADFLKQLRALEPTPHHELGTSRGVNPRWVYFTSGTTGTPKAVLHTDESLFSAALGYAQFQRLGSDPFEVAALCFPLAHIGGILFLTCALVGGYPVLVVPKFDPDALPGLLARHRVTVTGGGAVFYQMLVSAQVLSGRAKPLVPSLRMLTGGGAPCPPELHRRVREILGIPVLHAYGMTEAAMVCVSRADDSTEQCSYSTGSPIPGVTVRIVGADGADREGEIEISGPNLCAGYLCADQWMDALTADGWFRTGDRGYLRPDGRIVLTGRAKDLIIRKGENIAPVEIENELLAHPRIDEVAVVGLPDELRGELVCAVVRRSTMHPDITLAEVCAFLDERGLMKQKWPERLVVLDEFPITGLGKVAKNDLVRQIAELGVTA